MVHTDKIVRDLEFIHEGVFDFKELLRIMKEFFSRHDYDIDEKLYDTKNKNDLKTTTIKWNADRKVDDYNKCIVKLAINIGDYKEGYVDGIKVVDGKLKITFNAEVERDYDEKWKKSPTKKFFRAIYEKYITEAKQSKVDNNLRNLVENLRKEIKQYFSV
ncbi:hypothetical protein HYU23_02380 [Candidatus Woesearchaeota archaeon]|nr:hypothetical protein [Candidatus Woesearchaeota archaeon]